MKCPKCGAELELHFSVVEKKPGDWRDKPATQAQIEALKRFGVQVSPNITKGQAHDLLEFHIAESRKR